MSIGCVAASAAAPTLYAQPAYQSPVQGEPDDLLFLAGYGLAADDSVVYEALSNTTLPAPAPSVVPAAPTATAGTAAVVSASDVPYSLTIRLPAVMQRDQAYALWVRTAAGEWSAPVKINDARPLWFSPAYVYASAPIAGLSRYLKVVGRNLEPALQSITRVRLSGPETVTLTTHPSNTSLGRYVATVALPTHLEPGRYRVALTRDGIGWVELSDQVLEVRADPPIQPEFSVSDPKFGGCRANDYRDDTRCIINAIAAAAASGHGTVTFGAGTWDLIDSRQHGVLPINGIVVPRGVNLTGRGRIQTRLVRHPDWNASSPTVTFSLDGDNVVSGFSFQDAQAYTPKDRVGPFLQLGENFESRPASARAAMQAIRNIVITRNAFDRTQIGISDGGLPIERLFVTYNIFGTYNYELELAGNRFNMIQPFRVDDSVITHNTFEPGSYLRADDRSGAMASEIGASHRMDFSDNVADGSAADYLYSADDPHGWRAGFFWHLQGNQELLLISQNVASCTGDKIGDGEAIAFDNNANTFAFDAMRPVLAADASSITVVDPIAARQNDREVPLASYYVGHWVQVGDGPGIGQTRKITQYSFDPATGRVTIHVAPRWDVVPAIGTSRVSVGREFWQAYIVDNRIDHRAPPCRKSNRSRDTGGIISFWAQGSDSVVAGNEQYDTDGIVFNETYRPPEHPCVDCTAETFFQSFLAIQDNLIDGRYDTHSDCNASGITGWVSAAPWGSAAPPTLGYGISISHNRLNRAENAVGGAISVSLGWFPGPPPHRWPIVDNILVQHNTISGDEAAIPFRSCDSPHLRTGISFPAADLTWQSVLYGNSCTGVPMPLGMMSRYSLRACPSSTAHSCECSDTTPPR